MKGKTINKNISFNDRVFNTFETLTGDGLEDINGYGTMKPKNLISSILGGTPGKPKSLAISNPHDFRQVCFIYFILNICIYT